MAGTAGRIASRIAFLDAQINAGDIEYEQAKAHLDDCLALAGDCHAIYMSIDDSLRRIANQAFYERLIVTDDHSVDGEPGTPSTCSSTPKYKKPRPANKDRPRNLGLKPAMSPV